MWQRAWRDSRFYSQISNHPDHKITKSRNRLLFLLSTKHPRYPAHDSAQWKFAGMGNKYLALLVRSVVPAFQQRKMISEFPACGLAKFDSGECLNDASLQGLRPLLCRQFGLAVLKWHWNCDMRMRKQRTRSGLWICVLHVLHVELHWAIEQSLAKLEQSNMMFYCRALHDDGAQLLKSADYLRHACPWRFHLLYASMQPGCLLKLQLCGCCIALSFKLRDQRFRASIEIVLHAGDLGHVLGMGAARKARRQTHLHLRVHASGKCRIRPDIKRAPTRLEEVERIVQKFVGCGLRRKWTVI